MRVAASTIALRVRAALSLVADGFTREEIAKAMNLSYPSVCLYLRKGGVPNFHAENTEKTERNLKVLDMYRNDGLRMEEIGKALGITRERVRQILWSAGVTTADRGLSQVDAERIEALKAARAARFESLEAKTQKLYGCSVERLNEINGGAPRSRAGTPCYIFQQQRKSAQQRGIVWELSFIDWWQIWQDSGHWEDRGRGLGKYCMARTGDTGPYSASNVRIATTEENIAEGFLVKPARQRNPKMARDLSPRQKEVASLLDAGFNQFDIADRLKLTRTTTWQHIAAVKRKRELQGVSA